MLPNVGLWKTSLPSHWLLWRTGFRQEASARGPGTVNLPTGVWPPGGERGGGDAEIRKVARNIPPQHS